jgi:mercuric ion binding protein
MTLVGLTMLLALLTACNRVSEPVGGAEPAARTANLPVAPSAPPADSADPQRAAFSALANATLSIDGMVCESCAQAVHKVLANVAGVDVVEVDFQRRTARVQFDPTRTTVAQLAIAVEQVSRSPAPPFRVTARE